MRKIRAVLRSRFVHAAKIAFQKHTAALIALQEHCSRIIARRILLDELPFTCADKLRQLLDIALRNCHLADAATIRARGAIDLGFNLFAETPQAPVGMPVVLQIRAKPHVLLPLLLLEAPYLDEVGYHY